MFAECVVCNVDKAADIVHFCFALPSVGSAPNANASTPSATSASGADERYSYLLLLLSKLKIENVALRSKLDQQAVSAVTDAVSSELGKLPR